MHKTLSYSVVLVASLAVTGIVILATSSLYMLFDYVGLMSGVEVVRTDGVFAWLVFVGMLVVGLLNLEARQSDEREG